MAVTGTLQNVSQGENKEKRRREKIKKEERKPEMSNERIFFLFANANSTPVYVIY